MSNSSNTPSSAEGTGEREMFAGAGYGTVKGAGLIDITFART